MLGEIDLMIRGAVIGVAVLIFTLLWGNPATRARSYPVGALCLSVIGNMLQAPSVSGNWSDVTREAASIIGHFMPIAMTWFITNIFLERTDRQSGFVKGLWGLACATWVLCLTPALFGLVHLSMLVALQIGLLYLIISTGPDDLIERRRSFRTVFVTLMILFSITKILVDAQAGPDGRAPWIDMAFACAILVFAGVFANWALCPRQSIWTEEKERPEPRQAESDPVDIHVLTRVKEVMEAQIWRREGLTIGAMAEELNLPEHRLRKAINQDLGYRNFSSFVNGYRIEAAKAALTAPENAQKTILEIAYDVGFASLGPFNKAFRAMTGTSPRDFRRQSAGNASISV